MYLATTVSVSNIAKITEKYRRYVRQYSKKNIADTVGHNTNTAILTTLVTWKDKVGNGMVQLGKGNGNGNCYTGMG